MVCAVCFSIFLRHLYIETAPRRRNGILLNTLRPGKPGSPIALNHSHSHELNGAFTFSILFSMYTAIMFQFIVCCPNGLNTTIDVVFSLPLIYNVKARSAIFGNYFQRRS